MISCRDHARVMPYPVSQINSIPPNRIKTPALRLTVTRSGLYRPSFLMCERCASTIRRPSNREQCNGRSKMNEDVTEWRRDSPCSLCLASKLNCFDKRDRPSRDLMPRSRARDAISGKSNQTPDIKNADGATEHCCTPRRLMLCLLARCRAQVRAQPWQQSSYTCYHFR